MNAHNRTSATPKLKSPIDQKKKGKRTSFAVQSFAVLVCLALVLGPCIWLAMTAAGKRELTQTGIQTTATITEHYSKSRYGAEVDSGTSFWINYTLTPDYQAEHYVTHVELPLDLWDTVKVGSTISVTYNPRNASEHQPTMMLKRLSPSLTSIIEILVGLLSVGVAIWLTHLLFRVTTSRRRKIKASDPGTNMAGRGTSKNNRLKKHRSQRDAAKTPMVEKALVVLVVIAAFLGIFAVFSIYASVFVLGLEFLGPLVVEAMQNILL